MLRAVARSYLVGPEALGRLGADPAAARDRFSLSYLVAVAARAIKELALLAGRAARAGRRLSTLTLETEICFASAAARGAFAEELATTLARLTAKYHDERPSGHRRFRCFVGVYPAVTVDEPAPPGSVRLE